MGYVSVGMNYNFASNMSVGIEYTGAFRNKEMSNIIGINIQYTW